MYKLWIFNCRWKYCFHRLIFQPEISASAAEVEEQSSFNLVQEPLQVGTESYAEGAPEGLLF